MYHFDFKVWQSYFEVKMVHVRTQLEQLAPGQKCPGAQFMQFQQFLAADGPPARQDSLFYFFIYHLYTGFFFMGPGAKGPWGPNSCSFSGTR